MAGDWIIGNANDVLLDGFCDEFTGDIENDVTAYFSLCQATPNAIANVTGSGVSPIVVTTAAAHGLSTGAVVTIVNVGGNGAAKGTFTISVLSSTTFSLNGSTGDGTYTGGGEWYLCIANASAVAMGLVGPGAFLGSLVGSIPLVDGQQLALIIYCLGTYRDLYNAILNVTARRRYYQ